MSSGSTEKNNDILNKRQNKVSYDVSKLVFDVFKYKNNQHIFGISNATVSFSSLSKKKQINKISSKNKIAFTQLDSEFKNILIQEFTDSPKQFFLKR